jgi:hypothetical protein
MITTTAINGAEERDIAKVSGHSSTAVLHRYVRDPTSSATTPLHGSDCSNF